ncbi:hypothetical protein ALT721_2520034 [Alteromonas alvinellae]
MCYRNIDLSSNPSSSQPAYSEHRHRSYVDHKVSGSNKKEASGTVMPRRKSLNGSGSQIPLTWFNQKRDKYKKITNTRNGNENRTV